MSTSNDGSESVDQFLARIASLREGKDEASEERTKRIEEDFQKSRKERQARRLERARSLSPSKTGPARTSVLSSPAPMREVALNPPVDFSPQSSTLSRSNAVRTSPILAPKQRNEELILSSPPPLDSPTNTSTLSRSGTLSWQQRPSPGERNLARPRPLSTIATVRPVSRDGDQSAQDEKEPTRQEIAASLASRDPTWFRQTQDRGHSSAAFRKNQVEDTPKIETGVRSMRLPGLSPETTLMTKSAEDCPQETPTRERPLPPKPTLSSTLIRPEIDASSSGIRSTQRPASPPPTSKSQKDTSTERPSPDSNLVAAARSPSPTKGLGGFVQSAMMKRSDSVNKRWSVQATGGLKRGDSIAGMRPLSGLGLAHSPVRAREGQVKERGISASPITSRPGSSQGIVHTPAKSASPEPEMLSKEAVAQPVLLADPKPEEIDERPITPPTDSQLNRTQSRTLDSRRWSPTKSSWLESTLLSKPELPKMTPKAEDQPRWKVDLQRSRSRRDTSPSKFVKAEEKDNAAASLENPVKSGLSLKSSKKELSKDSHVAKQLEKSIDTDVTQAKYEPSETEADTNSGTIRAPLDPSSKVLSSTSQSTNAELSSRSSGLISPEIKPEKKPPVIKPKPHTPPKTDFRASLKPRVAPTANNGDAEPEFKAIFGKLKSAQTKNYVAPDILKDNILTGKAALSLTGGPQKTKRVDEFKESILQKKEAMKATAETKKQEPGGIAESQKTENPLPEALARRKTLHKATPSITKIQESMKREEFRPETKARPFVPQKDKDIMSKQDVPGSPATSVLSPFANLKPLLPTTKPEKKEIRDSFMSKDLAKPLIPPKSLGAKTSFDRLKEISSKQDSSKITPRKEEYKAQDTSEQENSAKDIMVRKTVLSPVQMTAQDSVQSTAGGPPAGGKLATRLNPNLAALLTRGSSPRPPAFSSPSTDETPQASNTVTPLAREGESNSELTHATKARAKGPKRRAPKAQVTLSEPKSSPLKAGETSMVEETTQALTHTKSLPSSRASAFTKPLLTKSFTEVEIQDSTDNGNSTAQNEARRQEINSATPSNTPAKPKPSIAAKSPELRRASSNLNQQTTEQPLSKPGTPKKFEIAVDKVTADLDPPTSAVHRFPSPKPSITAKPLTPSKSRLNTAKQPQLEISSAKTTTSTTLPGGDSDTKPAAAKSTNSTTTLQPGSQKSEVKFSASSFAPTTSDAAIVSEVLDKYFPTRPKAADRAEFDVPALLSATKEQLIKLKTVSKNIWEITSGGKKISMPTQQEHILYEDSMYLVVHVYESSAGAKASEVYLWCGDQVSEGAIEDIQLFCKKDAREHNTKLEIIKQGKEPARFFQALGDIVIVRRNKSSALYMLCGRRHMGCMAFDEVDFSVENLCSGYPYLISAKFGKLYLWKGKGSAADEVGCARLIGMDIGLTGEIEEVDEGAETDSFWEAFSDPTTKKIWAREWQQRAEHNEYPPTLYRVEHDRPKSAGGFWGLRSASPPKSTSKASIELLEPLCYRDMDPSHVYILDTYRSIYVLLDSKASSKKAEFTTALHVAQEISMLSPSIQGRTMIPTCYVSFGEPPADVKACFRKWPSEKRQTVDKNPSACVRLEDVMQVLGI